MTADILLVLACVIIQSVGQLTLKHGMTSLGRIDAGNAPKKMVLAFTRFPVLAGFAMFASASFLWLVVLSRVPVSWAYPMMSLSYVVVVISSRFVLHENVPPMRLVGTLIICAGVALISQS